MNNLLRPQIYFDIFSSSDVAWFLFMYENVVTCGKVTKKKRCSYFATSRPQRLSVTRWLIRAIES